MNSTNSTNWSRVFNQVVEPSTKTCSDGWTTNIQQSKVKTALTEVIVVNQALLVNFGSLTVTLLWFSCSAQYSQLPVSLCTGVHSNSRTSMSCIWGKDDLMNEIGIELADHCLSIKNFIYLIKVANIWAFLFRELMTQWQCSGRKQQDTLMVTIHSEQVTFEPLFLLSKVKMWLIWSQLKVRA